MKKIVFILLLMTAPIFCGNNISTIYSQELNKERVINDIDTINSKIDTSYNIVKKIGNILSYEVKTYGLKRTIQANSSIFAPAFIFLVLFLLYLKGRRK